MSRPSAMASRYCGMRIRPCESWPARLAPTRLRATTADHGVCTQLLWLTANGKKQWRYKLRKSLPPGSYVLYVRPVTPIGTPVAGFTAARHNRLTFTVK